MRALCLSSVLIGMLGLPLTGCTIGAPGTPTLENTTSAEQTQRIFWDKVKQQKWQTVQSLLVPNVVWRNGNSVLTRDQIVPYLQQLQVKEVLISSVTVRSNENEMTVVYDLQLTAGGSPQPQNWRAVAVWQQVPAPAADASKQQKKEAAKAAPYLLTVEDLVRE